MKLAVFFAGNDARGDDALGPLLAARLEALPLPELRVVRDFQFQVEHALELAGMERALFVDAHRSQHEPACLERLVPAADCGEASHALTPAQVLAVAERIGQPWPPAWLLSLRGRTFGLGEPLGASGRLVLGLGWGLLRYLIAHPAEDCWQAMADRHRRK